MKIESEKIMASNDLNNLKFDSKNSITKTMDLRKLEIEVKKEAGYFNHLKEKLKAFENKLDEHFHTFLKDYKAKQQKDLK